VFYSFVSIFERTFAGYYYFGIIVFYLQQIAKRATNDVQGPQSKFVKGLRIFSL